MLIKFSITLKPGTPREEAERIREETLRGLQFAMELVGQEQAIVGSSLEVD